MSDANIRALPYHEPGVETILIQSSFLLLLNIFERVADLLLNCGLIGQILVGLAWGTPGAQWLTDEFEHVVVQLGYLGLLLLVYGGGLSTNFVSLKANFVLSTCVALTGIALPMSLSFLLMEMSGATPLQAFAAGAALCSTSLGTTFTILGSTGLMETRLGTILSSAAMFDDVVGLVMVQIIQSVGGDASSFSAVTVIRPLFVAVAFGTVCPLIAWIVARPALKQLHGLISRKAWHSLLGPQIRVILHLLLLIGLVAASSYAGTSNLFAAYLAGAIVTWLDGSDGPASGVATYTSYIKQPLERLLRPLFFASIGFSIPIAQMFDGAAVWQGVVYTILMLLAKLACGLWLVRLGSNTHVRLALPDSLKRSISHCARILDRIRGRKTAPPPKITKGESSSTPSPQEPADMDVPSPKVQLEEAEDEPLTQISQEPADTANEQKSSAATSVPKPVSLYPSVILGMAMVSRGEIGFLISSLAYTEGIFSLHVYLVVTWAIVLCTVIGPVTVGSVVKRVRGLEGGSYTSLGVWGVTAT